MPGACAILSSVARPAVQYFSTLSHRWHDFRKVIEHKMCFDFLYSFSLKHFLFCKTVKEIRSKMYIGLHAKYALFLLDFNQT